MKIEKIKKEKNGKYKIFMDNGEVFQTFDDVILKHQLLFQKEISTELLKELDKDTSYYSIYNKILKFIQKRIRSKKEIVEYLHKNEIDEIDSKKILEDLSKNGWINDEKFCEAYVSDKIYLSSSGPTKIYKELMNHQIDEKIIHKYLDKIEDDVIYDRLYKMMDKKIKQNHKYSRSLLKQKILSYYLEEGYSKEMILSIFDELYKENSSIIEKEAEKIRKKLALKYEGEELEYKLISKLYQKGFLKEEIDKIKEESY